MLQKSFKELFLIQDQVPPHIVNSFQRALKEAKIHNRLIPKRMTPILQMADICWFSGMKTYVFKLTYLLFKKIIN